MWGVAQHKKLVAAVRASAVEGIDKAPRITEMFLAFSTQSVLVAAQSIDGKRPYAYLNGREAPPATT